MQYFVVSGQSKGSCSSKTLTW